MQALDNQLTAATIQASGAVQLTSLSAPTPGEDKVYLLDFYLLYCLLTNTGSLSD